MDDKRFDALTKALAKGANRRNVFKGLLGLGGAALTGSVVLEGDSEAARRPPATRTPVPRCPGGQTWNPATSKCDCPVGKSQCAPNGGPACCNTGVPVGPGYSECCDNACCHYPNDCVGEEMCCPRLPEVGCLDSRGRCCTTLCEETPLGVECCPSDEFCPGGSTSPDLCCDGETPVKCACGTNGNICISDSDAACCIAADCDTPPDGYSACWTATCEGHVCVYHDCAEGSICCPDNRGVYACRAGGDECCLNDEQCADTCEACVNFVCVDDPDTFPCGPENDPDKYCCPDSDYSLCCGATQFECCGVDSVHGVTRECDADGKCCEWTSPYYCTASKVCCAAACVDFREGEYCCPPDQGRVCPGASQFFCCPNGQECSSDGECCAAGTVSCGDECCLVDNICCQTAAGVDGDCCSSITQCNTDGECCAADSKACGADCCSGDTPQCCNGNCVAADETCCEDNDDCTTDCEHCDVPNGICVSDCGDGTTCCTEGPDDDCCAVVECLDGYGCCPVLSQCGTECCDDDHRCCTNSAGVSHCIPKDLPLACCDNNQCQDAPALCLDGVCGFEQGFYGQCTTVSTCADPDQPCCFGICSPVGATCCDDDGDCTGDCEHCDTMLHYCVDDCGDGTTCCTEGPVDDCCTSTEQCLPGYGCCANVCGGDECCEEGFYCCTRRVNGVDESHCIADGSCCRNNQCPDDTDNCLTGICRRSGGSFSGTCIQRDDCPTGTCCDGFCADAPGECCDNDACGACEICNLQSHTCVDDPNCCPGGCGTCGKCDDGDCVRDSSRDCGSACAECQAVTDTDGRTRYNCFDCSGDTPDCCGSDLDACVNKRTDNDNCGACGTKCTGCADCVAGVCSANQNGCTEACTTCVVTGNHGTCVGDCDPLACEECDVTGTTCVSTCDPLACEVCDNDGGCPDFCLAEGLECDGAGACCVPVDGDCSAGGTCCDGATCCDGTCTFDFTICGDVCLPGEICCPQNAACVVSGDCCGFEDGDICCRIIGPGPTCKPGQGQCLCATNDDCVGLPNQPTCTGGVCV